MRKGPWIRADKLVYAEIPNLHQAVNELKDEGLISVDEPAPADHLLDLFTLPELGASFPHTRRRFRPQGKAAWVNCLLSNYPEDVLRHRIQDHLHWLRVAGQESLARMQLLYFGSPSADLTAFVLRDLGMIRYEIYPVEESATVLVAPGVLDRYRELVVLEKWFDFLPVIDGLTKSLHARLVKPVTLRAAERRRSRLLNTLGLWHERREDVDRALACYACSSRHPARERQVRLLTRTHREFEAELLLEAMAARSWCVEEEIFAERFSKQRGLKQPDECLIRERPLFEPGPPPNPGAIEAHALAELETEGAWGLHLENVLPLMLTGLAFWDVIFGPAPGAFTHPFQSAPHDLWWDDFAKARAAPLQQARAAFASHRDPQSIIQARYLEKYGTACDLVNWRAIDPDQLARILKVMPTETLKRLVDVVIQAPGRCRTGFPDLFVAWPDGTCEFVEVKGPSDQLQPQQRAWLKRLGALAIPASVLKYRRRRETSCAT